MNTLPTEPSRYIAFKRTYVYFAYDYGIVTDGHCSEFVKTIQQILCLWDDNPPETVYDMDNEKFVPLVLDTQ